MEVTSFHVSTGRCHSRWLPIRQVHVVEGPPGFGRVTPAPSNTKDYFAPRAHDALK